jgi:hypothetical protein
MSVTVASKFDSSYLVACIPSLVPLNAFFSFFYLAGVSSGDLRED